MIRAILIDDEPLAIQVLERKLEETGEYEIVATFQSELEWKGSIDDLQYDVAFVDIQLVGSNGLNLVREMQATNKESLCIFVTAYEEYAVNAFEINVLDYLLKPVSTNRLKTTTERIHNELELRGLKAMEEKAHSIQINLFQEFSVYYEKKLVHWKTSKVKELFAYLLTYHNQYVERDMIIEALWPGEDYQKSKRHLHTCMYHLRKKLKSIGFDHAVTFLDKRYLLQIETSTDVDEWKKAMNDLHEQPDSVEPFNRVLTLYTGKYLERDDYEWAKERMQAHHFQMISVMVKMKNYYSDREQLEETSQCLNVLMKEDPYSEELVQEMMGILRRMGRRADAVSLYEAFAERLQTDLQLKPSARLRAFSKGI
ncbi:response regulator [Alkalihalobacillus hemicellulosilyticus]|uniref:DNA-binding response regulator n=1 Tax=Halalkalibacter hemicellulosilyticusJCM 9152 TaxID=1236971 RepID=W4QIT4_9BACI|nr:response regulator [Halalkalibacter hemicellulosilyticus]GAE31827.1 DNA-binding response regulator [Halalkalibacter hemicellulosilyticusJCM 9152]